MENNKRNSIRHWAEDDRPREKMLQKGPEALSNAELIAILLGSGNASESAVDLAKRILRQAGDSLTGLSRLELGDLRKFKGVGPAKAVTIRAAIEMGKRRLAEQPAQKTKIESSRDAFNVVRRYLEDNPYEKFSVLLLNKAHEPIAEPFVIGEGGLDGTVADPKRIMRLALEYRASAMILAHNHPSGNLKASTADQQLTRKISDAARLLDIQVLDHLIIGINGYYSFADEGKM